MVSKYRFIYRRLATVLPTAFISLTIIFFLIEIVPGDTADVLLGPGANQQDVEILRKMLGLDLPPHERYLDFLSGVFRGDFGKSLATSQSVNKLILEALPVTLTLAITSMLIALLIGIPSGIVSAIKRNTKTDLFVSLGALVGISIPGFWLGLLMLLFFSVYLKVLPAAGFVNPFIDHIEGIKHLIMPSLMLGLILAGFISRITRSSLIEVMLQDYILAARAKGLPERIIIYKHALKNALIPVVTVIGFQFGALLGGSIIAETIFGMAGMGKLIYSGIMDRDFPVVEGVAITMVLIFIFLNLVIDLIYMYLDPRVRLG
ncbi:Glutathione transport system permease protein GsiC [archaeon HR06]|nr:Glutathione transport system permease protein GsiC [archaeon HR06]